MQAVFSRFGQVEEEGDAGVAKAPQFEDGTGCVLGAGVLTGQQASRDDPVGVRDGNGGG